MKKKIILYLLLFSTFLFAQTKTWDKDPQYQYGNERYVKDFQKAFDIVVSGNYVVYGAIKFSISIDDKGSAKVISMVPKLKNSEQIINDLNYVLRKKNKNWTAAKSGNDEVSSFFLVSVT